MWTIKAQLSMIVSLVALYIVVFVALNGDHDHEDLRPRLGPVSREVSRSSQVLVLIYTGQQVAGIRGIYSLQCTLRTFNLQMSIVAPFIENSKLRHSSEIWKRSTQVSTFGDYYDILHFNEESRAVGNPELVLWDAFLQTSHRSLVVVTIQNHLQRNCLRYINIGNKAACSGKSTLDTSVLTRDCSMAQDTEQALEYLSKFGFEIKRHVCLNCELDLQDNFSPQKIMEHVFGDEQPKNVSLVINRWRFNYHITPKCTEKCIGRERNAIKPSNSLSSSVQLYHSVLVNRLNIPPSSPKLTVGIMIRVEWLMIGHVNKDVASARKCLMELMVKYNSIEEKGTAVKLPILALDIGKYGSSTFYQTMELNHIKNEDFDRISAAVADFVHEVYDRKLTFKEWEDTYTEIEKGVQESSHTGYLQNTLVAEADCIMLMGGGHFQELALNHYLSMHPEENRCVHQVCTFYEFAT